GTKLGNFDVVYDAGASEQMLVGQLAYRDNRTYFDVWTRFAVKSKQPHPEKPDAAISLDDFRIDAAIEPDLSLKATTHVSLRPKHPMGRAIAFSISNRMRVLEAQVDGQPAEVFQKESLRSNPIRSSDNEEFLVVTTATLEPGKAHDL